MAERDIIATLDAEIARLRAVINDEWREVETLQNLLDPDHGWSRPELGAFAGRIKERLRRALSLRA